MSEDINPNMDPDLQVRNQELYTTPDRIFCSLLNSPALGMQCQGEQLSLDLPFSCINCEVKRFNSQELNIFLHFNSRSLTEADSGATLNCCPWLWWCQRGSRAGFALGQRGTELSYALVSGTEIN